MVDIKCPGCGGSLVFDPATKRLECDYCGGSYDPEEFGYVSQEEIERRPEFMDANQYVCNSCGASIFVSPTEASSHCVYCGSPSIAFSKLTRIKRPETILPFKITREDAASRIKAKFSSGAFIPKVIKDCKIDDVRGIYIPYWIMNVKAQGDFLYKGEEGTSDSKTTYFYTRSGSGEYMGIAMDSSRLFPDEISAYLDYDMKDLVPFNESYLSGFYSDVFDVERDEIIPRARYTAAMRLNDTLASSVKASSVFPIAAHVDTEITSDVVPAMLPAWFFAVTYRGKPYTVIVNGQNGDVTGSVPFDSAKVAWFVVLISILATVLLYLINPIGLSVMMGGFFALFFAAAALALMTNAISRIKKGSSAGTLNYMRRRQK